MLSSEHVFLSKPEFLNREVFSRSKESLTRSSFRIDDLLRSQTGKRFIDNVSERTETATSPSPATTPVHSPSHPVTQPASIGSMNVESLAMPVYPSMRSQHPLFAPALPYPYSVHPLLRFGMNFSTPNGVFGRDLMPMSPYMTYPPLDLPFLLRDRLLQLTEGNGARKCRRSRTVFSELQLVALEKRFERQKYLSTPDRMELADALGLTQLQVKTWYQNRRMKWKKQVQPNDTTAELEQEQVTFDKEASHTDEQARHSLAIHHPLTPPAQTRSFIPTATLASHAAVSDDIASIHHQRDHDRFGKSADATLNRQFNVHPVVPDRPNRICFGK